MSRTLAAVAIAVGMVVAVAAWAEPPRIAGFAPFGARRGEATEVLVTGSALGGNPRLIAPFSAEVAAIGGDAGNWKLRITPAATTPVGVYVVRVRTDEGLSNPLLFAVGQVAQVAEREDNGTFETAQPIPSPVVVEGQTAANDVDYFRFAGKKGQRIVVDAQCGRIGSGVDPSIRLTTAARGFIASADDTPGLMTDARLTATLPEDTDYVIELSDSRYQGGARPIYRLLVGALPVADEIYPLGGRRGETIGLELAGGTLAGPAVAGVTLRPAPGESLDFFRPRITNQALGIATPGEPVLDLESIPPLALDAFVEVREPTEPGSPPLKAFAPVVFNGRIEAKRDEDSFVVRVTPGQRLQIKVDAASLGSALDGVLQVKGPDGAVLATADDTTDPVRNKARVAAKKGAVNSPDPSLNFTVPAGMTEMTLTLRDLRGDGGPGFPYRLTVEPIPPVAFQVTTDAEQISIPRGGTSAVTLTVTRAGYDGPITLTVANPPPGLTVRPGLVGPGQAAGALTLAAAADASFDLVTLDLIGEAKGPSGTIVAHSTRSLVFAEQSGLPTNVVLQSGLPAASSLPTPITLDAPATPIEIVHGYPASVSIKAVRAREAEDAVLTFGSVTPPPGLTVAATAFGAKTLEGAATINSAVEGPLGPAVIVLTAKGKMANQDRTLGIPAVTVEVVRPAAVELATPTIEIKAGATVEIKGRIVRRGPFKEPVTVKLDALPDGLKADPVALTPDQAEFILKVVADRKATAAQANAQVGLAFQVNKKDYATPPTPLAVKITPAP